MPSTHQHELIRAGEGCFLCFIGCPDDWTPETCSHRYSVHMESLVATNGSSLTYFTECDACGRRL